MMNGESVLNTPSSSISKKKRELTSPDFDIESKNNKLLSASSESDVDSTVSADISITDEQTITDLEAIMAMATSTPLPVEEVVGWLVGFGFNGPLRQYFSLYRAVSQREGERGERIDETKNVQTTPTRTYCEGSVRYTAHYNPTI